MIPEPLKSDELEALVIKLREGDVTVKERLVLHYFRLAFSMARKYSKMFGMRYYDVMVSEALYCIVLCLNGAKENLVDNDLTTYLVSKLHWALCDTVSKDKVLKVPISTYNQHKRENNKKFHFYPRQANGIEMNEIIDPKQSWLEVNDLINHLVENDMEMTVLRLRLEGYTYPEIAKKVGTYPVHVLRTLRKIKERYSEKN